MNVPDRPIDWQGNVRELANAMEYAWIVAGGQPIAAVHLPHDVRSGGRGPATVGFPPPAAPSTSLPRAAPSYPISAPPAVGIAPETADGPTKSLADVEMEYILQIYAKNKFNKQRTADELGISLKTLYNKLHKYEEERQQRAG